MDASEFITGFLQLLGYVASLAVIPLIIYLFLRSRETKAEGLRRDIVRIFANQIGEGRYISVFEIQSVIESESRTHGLRGSLISQDEIVEDLVSDTVTNPMLESQRKQQIVNNLREIHSNSAIYKLLNRNRLHLETFLRCIGDDADLTPEDQTLIDTLKGSGFKTTAETPSRYADTTSTLFGVCSAIIILILLVISATILRRVLTAYGIAAANYHMLVNMAMGAVGALIAGLLVAVFSRAKGVKKKTPVPENAPD